MAGVLNRSWNYERQLVFSRAVIKKTLGICRSREIRDRVTRRMDVCDRGTHVGLMGGVDAEGPDREDMAASEGEEEYEFTYQKLHKAVMSGKLFPSLYWETDREGGG